MSDIWCQCAGKLVKPQDCNGAVCDYEPDDGDEEMTDEEIAAEECGRWDNGRLSRSCGRAGSEQCDFECPYRNSLYRTRKYARPKP